MIFLYSGASSDPNSGYFYVSNATNENQYIEIMPDTTAPTEIQGKSWGVRKYSIYI